MFLSVLLGSGKKKKQPLTDEEAQRKSEAILRRKENEAKQRELEKVIVFILYHFVQ